MVVCRMDLDRACLLQRSYYLAMQIVYGRLHRQQCHHFSHIQRPFRFSRLTRISLFLYCTSPVPLLPSVGSPLAMDFFYLVWVLSLLKLLRHFKIRFCFFSAKPSSAAVAPTSSPSAPTLASNPSSSTTLALVYHALHTISLACATWMSSLALAYCALTILACSWLTMPPYLWAITATLPWRARLPRYFSCYCYGEWHCYYYGEWHCYSEDRMHGVLGSFCHNKCITGTWSRTVPRCIIMRGELKYFLNKMEMHNWHQKWKYS